ncbi:hypothetical protein ADICEAN_01149 [Cesiribacter andamanensis AMV16]|uniref:Uncharacterized protein n=1 Tax=Cesiribacter andamanensis AMV16 TaxID=1279009 RepID=M7NPS4_9BACT|nr:hypothetical protein ADICEAN_01149 [Cesiribacter andamanensis AMV16]
MPNEIPSSEGLGVGVAADLMLRWLLCYVEVEIPVEI